MLSTLQTIYRPNPIKTGYSSMGFFPKTKSISEIKRENLRTRQSTYNYIDSMYRTGGLFKYNLKKPHIGSHRFHLSTMENYVRGVSRNKSNDNNAFNSLKSQCDTMRYILKDDYNRLKYEMNTEIDNLQNKFNFELRKQKIENSHINKEMKELKQDMIQSQNLLIELKDRINSLKMRIDGNKMYNQDGLPVLQTNIEY